MKRCLLFFWALIISCSLLSCEAPFYSFHYINPSPRPIAPLKVIPIWIDGDFGAADQLAINDAIEQWNFALNGYVKLKVISTNFQMETEILQQVARGDGWLFLRIKSNSGLLHDDLANHHITLAFANRVGGNQIYVIRDRIPNEWMTGLMLHEIGHLLGSQHDKSDLMQPVYDWARGRCIDISTIKQVATYQHLPVEKLSHCVYDAP